MAEVDLSTYTETDPGGDLTVTASQITWATITEGAGAYVYYDHGVDFATGDFTDVVRVNTTSDVSGDIIVHGWFNHVGEADGGNGICLTFYSGDLYATEYRNGGSFVAYGSAISLSTSTDYWVEVERDQTNGDLIIRVFDDEARTNQIGTDTLPLTNDADDYRYHYAFQTQGGGEAGSNSGNCGDHDLELFAGSGITPQIVVPHAQRNYRHSGRYV